MYIVIDHVGIDIWDTCFDSEENAIQYAENEWNSLSEYDKRRRSEFYVLRSVADSIDDENAYDGDVVRQWK